MCLRDLAATRGSDAQGLWGPGREESGVGQEVLERVVCTVELAGFGGVRQGSRRALTARGASRTTRLVSNVIVPSRWPFPRHGPAYDRPEPTESQGGLRHRRDAPRGERCWDEVAGMRLPSPLLALLLFCLIPACLSSGGQVLDLWIEMKSSPQLSVRILTHNIRYATSSPFQGERPWADRRQLLLNELLFNTRHNQEAFICLQEVLHVQLVDILSGLNNASATAASNSSEWAYIGVGRDDGHEAGEYSPIFYRPAVWQLVRWETVWLSETPTKPSKGWDAASIRIVTIGVFRHHASRKTILALNTHLDDQGSRSRFEAARIILGKIDEYLTGEDGQSISGVFLSGDLNSEETQEAYKTLTAPTSPLVDVQKLVDPALRYGNEHTFTGFGYEGVRPTRIDYILLGPASQNEAQGQNHTRSLPWMTQGYAVLANRFDDGVFNSDHRAVVADVALA